MKEKIIFYVCLGITLALLVGGFLVPPTGVIDGSVLTGSAIILGFTTLNQITNLLKNGKDLSLKYKDAELKIDDNE